MTAEPVSVASPVAERQDAARSVAIGRRAAVMLCRREIVRFLRQRNRVVGALGQPILFWLLFGAGLRQTFQLNAGPDGPTFLEYYFPGTLVLILLFTAIFSTISIIEDRREGFLQAVLVAPAPRWAMVAGKVLGGALLATGQGALFLLLSFLLATPHHGLVGLLLTVPLVFLAALGMTGLGFVLAWRMESTQGFHAIMNLVLMPLWLLSGAFFPIPAATAGGTQTVLHAVMRLNPVTYAVAGVRQQLFEVSTPAEFWLPSIEICWLVTTVFALLAFAGAWRMAGMRQRGERL